MSNCSECGIAEADRWEYPDGTGVYLCDKCAAGLFCLHCGRFTGGTEDIFLYGEYACSECHSLQQAEMNDYYDDDDDWEYSEG